MWPRLSPLDLNDLNTIPVALAIPPTRPAAAGARRQWD
jgi:hypothetical protein